MPVRAQFCSLLLGVTLIGTITSATAQSKVVYLSPTTNSQTKPMTVEDVIKLSKAGLSDDLIIQQIKKKGQHFDLSTDQLVQLKAAHVSDRVIQVMIDPTKNTAPPPAEQMTVPAAPVQAAQPPLQANRQDLPNSLCQPRSAYTHGRRISGPTYFPKL